MDLKAFLLFPVRVTISITVWLWNTANALIPQTSKVFTPSDIIECKLMKICKEICREQMFQVFLWGTKKDDTTALDKYLLEAKGWTRAQVNKRFTVIDLEKFNTDPKGNTYDVTLLYKIIPWVCEELAPVGSSMWHTKGDTLESCLNQVKCFRNDLMHENTTFNNSTFIDMIERVQGLLTNMLEKAGDLYNIDRTTVKNTISKMNLNINTVRDGAISPQDMMNYRDDLLFADLGKKELKELYTRNEITYVNPASFIVGCHSNCEVERVFTPLKLKDSCQSDQEKDIEYEDILLLKTSQPQVILVEGIAGAGKTTITRHLVSQWCCNNPTIKGLGSYDLLIMMECRNSFFSSFSQLLDSLMPKTRSQFQDDDLPIFKRQKSLILVDGLDEMNENSRILLKDILDFKKNNANVQLLVFSRPEKLEDFFRMVQEKGYKVTHIKVGEIPYDIRDTFIEKYHNEMIRQGQSVGDTKELLQYVKYAQFRLKRILGLPLHLVMLTVLWASDPSSMKEIRTPTGMHLAFLTLSMYKLCQRLIGKVQFSVDEIKTKVKIFLFALSKMAFENLKDDIIVILTSDQISKLQQICDRLQLHPEEVTGAFLVRKKSWIATDTSISMRFTHKSQQDFQASLFLNHILLGGRQEDRNEEKRREIENKLLEIGYSSSVVQDFITSPPPDCELILPTSEIQTALLAPPVSSAPSLPVSPIPTAFPVPHISLAQPRPPGAAPSSSCIYEILKDVFIAKTNKDLKIGMFQETFRQLLSLMHMRGIIPQQEAQQMVAILYHSGIGYSANAYERYVRVRGWMALLTEVNQDTLARAIADKLHDQCGNGAIDEDNDHHSNGGDYKDSRVVEIDDDDDDDYCNNNDIILIDNDHDGSSDSNDGGIILIGNDDGNDNNDDGAISIDNIHDDGGGEYNDNGTTLIDHDDVSDGGGECNDNGDHGRSNDNDNSAVGNDANSDDDDDDDDNDVIGNPYNVAIYDDFVIGATLLFKYFLPKEVRVMTSSPEGTEDLIKMLMTIKKCYVKISISDSNVKFYMDMMCTHTFPHSWGIQINIKDPSKPEWEDFLQLLSGRQTVVILLSVDTESSEASETLCDCVRQLLLSCKVKEYRGRVKIIEKGEFPMLKTAHLSIEDNHDNVADIKRTMPNVKDIWVDVKKGVSLSVLTPLPRGMKSLDLSSLTDKDIEWGTKVTRILQPMDEQEGINFISCPDSQLTLKGSLAFVRRLKAVGVRMNKYGYIDIQSPHLRRLEAKRKDDFTKEIKNVLGCNTDIM